MKKVFVFCIFSVLFISCEKIMEKVYTIEICNKTNFNIIYYVADNPNKPIYPDTSLTEEPISDAVNTQILPSSCINYGGFSNWQENFEKLPSDTLSIFIFHSDTLAAYPWEVIREEYKILKRYDLSLQDLQRLDFKISYPPGPEMEGVKMYPPE